DAVGNPSSVHAEGRAAKAVVERARGQVARLVGCAPSEIVFTSGATEAAVLLSTNLVAGKVVVSGVEHDCLLNERAVALLPVDALGQADLGALERLAEDGGLRSGDLVVVPCANSETGILNDTAALARRVSAIKGLSVGSDVTQAVGKMPLRFEALGLHTALLSGHKLGGPKGVGAMVLRSGVDLSQAGGGQEMGRRSGTENVVGIAGFGAAAEAAQKDLDRGAWDRVEKLRNILEDTLASASNETIFVGNETDRLPNTSCFITPGWKGETQVMQMDLAGYAISAGSACSSGKVKESRVLRAMGFDSVAASSAVRVSLGPTTTEAEVLGFATAWSAAYDRWKQRAA
ncbi:MAG: aminotransferase class V-fold PLP-dependent enzyme, partial [Pseudomonadota bacterium]